MRANETGPRQLRMIDRLRLAAQRLDGKRPVRPNTAKLLREASYLVSPFTRRLRRAPGISRADNRQIVLILPGFIATPRTMRYLARQIEQAGHKAKRWNLGFNKGCLLYTSDAADDSLRVDLGGRRIIKKLMSVFGPMAWL